MSLFHDPQDEERLCQVLKAYVEEWGPENVIVSVPTGWKDYSDGRLGRVRLEFTTQRSVLIRVEYQCVRINFGVLLEKG